MSCVRSFSSQLMTQVMAYRNPEGDESNWNYDFKVQDLRENLTVWKDRVHLAKFAIPLLALTATVESLVYSALLIPSFLIYKLEPLALSKCFKLLDSSTFTIFWAFAAFTDYNQRDANTFTNESFARRQYDMMGHYLKFMREEDDQLYNQTFFDLQDDNLLDVEPTEAPQTDEISERVKSAVTEGSNFFKAYLLSDPQLKAGIVNLDPKIRPLVFAKAIYICAFGAAANEEVPDCFKPATKQGIAYLRIQNESGFYSPSLIKAIDAKLHSLESFNHESLSNEAEFDLLSRINNLAQGEEAWLFAFQCWFEAIGKESIPFQGNPFA